MNGKRFISRLCGSLRENGTRLLGLGLAAAAAAGSLTASGALSHPDSLISLKAESTKIIHLDGRPVDADELKRYTDSIRHVVSMFYYDQFRHFQDPDAPYFLFMSKDANLAMGIGGGVRMRAYYDWGGAVPTSSFAPYTIPIPARPASMRHFATTPSGTYLFFRVIGRNKLLGNYQLYIESDFTGYEGRDFRLKKAYAQVRDFTFGYATSTFSDPAATPPVADAAGNNNKFSNTSLLVRYMPRFCDHWYAGVSVETPSTAINSTNAETETVSDWLPDFAALLQYEWAGGQHVRLSGIARSLSYRDIARERDHNLVGWGAQLSGVTHPFYALTTYTTLNVGQGIGGMGGDLLYGLHDLVPDPKNPAKLYAPLSWGWTLGLQYNFTPMVFASVSASQTHYYPRHGEAGSEYRYGTFACVNLFWNILPRVCVCGELDWGYRRNISGEGRSAHRANLMAAFTF